MEANHGDLGSYISRNETITHHAEDDKEKLVRLIREYRDLVLRGDEGQVAGWLSEQGSDKNSVLGQIMNHIETREHLLLLAEFPLHFPYKKIYSMRWVKDNLHNIGGGVSATSVILEDKLMDICVADPYDDCEISGGHLEVVPAPRNIL